MPRTINITRAGVKTSGDFHDLMQAISHDIVTGNLSEKQANAIVRAQNGTLRMADLQMRHGKHLVDGRRELFLSDPNRKEAPGQPVGPTPEEARQAEADRVRQNELAEIQRIRAMLDNREQELRRGAA